MSEPKTVIYPFCVVIYQYMAQIKHDIAVSMVWNHMEGHTTESQAESISKMNLGYLPHGTKLISFKKSEKMVFGLYEEFEAVYEHPWFVEGMTFQTHHVREFYADQESDQLHQFNIFLGIEFRNPDGTPKHPIFKP